MKLPAKKIRKIAVFRALYLGDLLCAVPALRALRHAYPAAEISLVGLPWSRCFVERFHEYLDRFISFPGYPGLPEQIPDEQALLCFLAAMRRENFDLVLQMQGDGSFVNMLVQMFGSAYTAGFYVGSKAASPSAHFIRYPRGVAEIRRHLKLMESLGIPLMGEGLEFPVSAHDKAEFRELDLPFGARQYVCIHPGSRSAQRRWSPKYFAAVADHCVSRGLAVVITGTREETHVAREVRKYTQRHVIDLTGMTNLGTAGLLIGDAYALISNCTGVSHIADAMGTPSVIISMDGEPDRWAPLNKDLHHLIDWKSAPHFGDVFCHIAGFLSSLEKKDCVTA